MTVNRPVWTLKSNFDLDVQRRAVGVLIGDGRLVLRQPGRDRDVDRAEAERTELECRPVKVRIELFGDGDVLGGGAAVVLEIDRVGQVPVGWMKSCVPKPAGPIRALGSLAAVFINP